MKPWMRFFGDGLGKRVASSFPESVGLEDGDHDTRQHLSDYVTLANAADRMLEDRTAGFVLIHMPIPHPHGIYDRKRQQFAVANIRLPG